MPSSLAHADGLLPHDAWGAWNLHQPVVVSLIVVAAVYWRGHRPGLHPGRHRAFALGWATVAIALVSPVDTMAGSLASAHMVQHLLLMVGAAPLLAYAAPGATLARGAPDIVRRRLDPVRRSLGLTGPRLRRWREPAARLVIFTIVLWLWHASSLYTLALDHDAVHVLQHGSFLTAGYLVWVPILGAPRARLERIVAVALLFALALQNVVLSLLLTFSTEPWYSPYRLTAPDWGLDALTDQHLAGVLMWVPVGLVHLVIALGVLGTWLTDPESTTTEGGRIPRPPVGYRTGVSPSQVSPDQLSPGQVTPGHSSEIAIPVDGDVVRGDVMVPDDAEAVVVFAHGSGSSRFSERNQAVASTLVRLGQATVLMDLLTSAEEAVDSRTREHRFDIDLLATRVVVAVEAVRDHPDLSDLPIGLFGASTGAAAALVAAASRPDDVSAVVSRGGRPDLAGDALVDVDAPTLLIVGGADTPVVELNEGAAMAMRAPTELVLVEGATHLFQEPGALDEVAGLAGDWFGAHLLPIPDLDAVGE